MRTISVRCKGNCTPFSVFRVNGRDPEQVTLLAGLGYVCYANSLLMSENIWDSTIVISGDWALYDGHQVMFVHNVDQLFESPLAMYGGDSRTIEQVWRYTDGT